METPGTHLDLDTLADLDEGLLDETSAQAARRHLDMCAECRADADSVTAARTALHDLPDVAMPADVAARIDNTLAAEPTAASPATVVPLAPRRRRGAGLAGMAAAAAIVLLVAGVVAGALRAGRSPSKTTAGVSRPPATGALQYVETASGRNYTNTTLPQAVAALLGSRSHVPAAGAPLASPRNIDRSPAPTSGLAMSGGSAQSGTTAGLAAPVPGFLPAHPEFDRLHGQPLALFGCIGALTGQPRTPTVPLAVDFAEYNGKPAVIIVLPTAANAAKADVWVVGPGCSATNDQTLYFARVDR